MCWGRGRDAPCNRATAAAVWVDQVTRWQALSLLQPTPDPDRDELQELLLRTGEFVKLLSSAKRALEDRDAHTALRHLETAQECPCLVLDRV